MWIAVNVYHLNCQRVLPEIVNRVSPEILNRFYCVSIPIFSCKLFIVCHLRLQIAVIAYHLELLIAVIVYHLIFSGKSLIVNHLKLSVAVIAYHLKQRTAVIIHHLWLYAAHFSLFVCDSRVQIAVLVYDLRVEIAVIMCHLKLSSPLCMADPSAVSQEFITNVTEMLEKRSPLVINGENWGFADENFEEHLIWRWIFCWWADRLSTHLWWAAENTDEAHSRLGRDAETRPS